MAKCLSIFAAASLIALASFALPSLAGAQNLPDSKARPAPAVKGALNLAQCIRIALEQSPQITSDSLNISVKRLDVSDAKYAYIPTFSLATYYYLNAPAQIPGSSFSPYVIQFVTQPYNPIEVYFNLNMQKLLTRIAILAHCQVISDYLDRLAVGFLQLDSIEQMLAIDTQTAEMARQEHAYLLTRQNEGELSSMDLQAYDIQMQSLAVDKKQLEASRKTIASGIADILGLGSKDETLVFDLKNVRSQVLDDFNPADATLEEAQSNSFGRKIQQIKGKIQQKSITLAYLRFLPHFVWGVQTSDPLSGRQQSGMFFTVGLELPIWDGLKRYHDISRQKVLLQQNNDQGESNECDFTERWRGARQEVENASDNLQLAKAGEKLAELTMRRARIKYQSGSMDFPDYISQCQAHLNAEKAVVQRTLEYNKALLNLRILSGEFFLHFVSVKAEEAD